MAEFDTLIAGGHVIDPAQNRSGLADVAIKDGTIATVEPGIDRARAANVIDAAGQYVTPGLIDLHTHVYWGVTYWGIEPDPVAARSGVTTWLDVGSAGGYTFPGFRRWISEPAKSRVFALLNMSSIGLVAPTWELSNIDYCDIDLGQMIVERNRDIILGIKARIDASTTRGTGIEPLKRARELADKVELPLMVHIGGAPPTLAEIVEYLRPGDILTHCFTGQPNKIVDDAGAVIPSIKDLHDRGLVLDIGHGAGSFSFDTAEAMIGQGILPDVISTDIHQLAIQGPCFDMPVTLSKFLNLGMTIEQVIACATINAAKAIRLPELGTLCAGAPADVATFRLDQGEFTFQDVHMNQRSGDKLLVNTMTMVDGDILPVIEDKPLQPWAKLPAHQAGKVIPVRQV
ncbi:MAG TPA: amidohydrolase/deacetylase family metallohydrolase [Thermomicrobiales bacterium]|nr:amidohydrolase/deacetylase family metallohydrolase [Thermomicrobiales bacterium]